MNFISYSLFGTDRKYIDGAISNAIRVSEFPGSWQAVFYVGPDIAVEDIQKLRDAKAIVRSYEKNWHSNGMFWRFNIFSDFDFDFALVRDTDSFISNREFLAILDWIDSKKTLHVMRDHPFHNAPIMGGMWGATKAIKDKNIQWDLMGKYGNAHGQDQLFLAEEIFPKLRRDCLVHDSFLMLPQKQYCYPVKRQNREFVGQASYEIPSPDDLMLEDTLYYFETNSNRRRWIAFKFMVHLMFKVGR